MTDEELMTAWQTLQRGVVRTHQRILDHIDLGGRPDMWFSALHLLLNSAQHRLPMTTLARELSITTGGFTKLADRMARDGLIDRRGSSDDRRVVFAALTADGLTTAKKCERQYQEALRENVLDVLTPSIMRALIDAAALLNTSTDSGGSDMSLDRLAAKP